MAHEPIRRGPQNPASTSKAKPKIWAEGSQRPPFDLRGFARSSLYFSRNAVAPIHAGAARLARRVAVNVKNGAGRIPAERLGRFARFVPSHLRVAAWIKGLADVLSHASASADPDVLRGNALVAEIAPDLWAHGTTPVPAEAGRTDGLVAEVPTMALDDLPPPPHDPFAAIRDDLQATAAPAGTKSAPPLPRTTATGTMASQITGYVIGWLTAVLALPFGLVRALWAFAQGNDLRRIGLDD